MIRPLQRHYYPGTSGIIFVVDSIDRERLQESKEWLYGMLSEEDLKNIALLVFANK